MEGPVIIFLCFLVLAAYLLDISASRTRIPSVIILLFLGLITRQILKTFVDPVPDLNPLLPLFGTIGLILIVLEGTLEIDLEKKKIKVIKKSFAIAFVPMVITILLIAAAAHWIYMVEYLPMLIYTVPLATISSAIAIPTASIFHKPEREFVVYESSFSDILGVMIFNFFLLNEVINFRSGANFILQILISLPIAFMATALLSFLLSRVKHRVKFIPVIALIILLYALSKEIHLPALLLILILGLFLSNFQKINIPRLKSFLQPEFLVAEVKKFTEITFELSFLVRTAFFLLFGYSIEPIDIFNNQTILFSLLITSIIFILRAIHLKLLGFNLLPLLFVAPRGLITILLFISIPASELPTPFNESVIIQVVLLTVLIMMGGTILHNPKKLIISN